MSDLTESTLEQTTLEWLKALDQIVEWLAKRIPGGEA
jgi:hypothetical protein